MYLILFGYSPAFITLSVGVSNDNCKKCVLGLEKHDEFKCEYEAPCGICSKTMPILYSLCEIVRCGGNYNLRGSKRPYEIEFSCSDGYVKFNFDSYKKRT